MSSVGADSELAGEIGDGGAVVSLVSVVVSMVSGSASAALTALAAEVWSRSAEAPA